MIRPTVISGVGSSALRSNSFQPVPEEIELSYNLTDALVVISILALGFLAISSHDRARDFLYDDVYYADCARSLLQRGFYGIADRPETTQPPGVSAILAFLCLAGGCSRAVFLGAMAVFETLGFLACYGFLRRQLPRAVAGAICLLLMSSALYFSLATQWVSTCFPFLFATMGALLAARKLDKAESGASRIAWAACLSVLLAASLMFGATALALLGSIVLWIGISLIRDCVRGFARCKKFALVLLVAAVVQGIWMSRKPFGEWPQVPGFPGPYLQQLLLKDGHNPELGKASVSDIPKRVGMKSFEQSMMLAEVLFRRWIDPFWGSVLLLGPTLLILLGWGYTVWKTRGGIAEWYFAGAEIILMLWPWRLDPRSFLPLGPLACLYLWRGVPALVHLARNKARLPGLLWLPVAVGLVFVCFSWTRGTGSSGSISHAGLQDEASIVVWMLSGIAAACMIWKGNDWLELTTPPWNRFSRLMEDIRINPRAVAGFLGGVAVIGLIVIGVKAQWQMRRGNLDSVSAPARLPPDVEAALWVRDHTEPHAVVMARQVPTTYHYSGREMVWFPPSSNGRILMDGIHKYRVNYVVLIRRKQSYFLPPEGDCFAAVLAENENAFRKVEETSDYRIYETSYQKVE